MRKSICLISALLLVFVIAQLFVVVNWPLVDWDESVYIGMGKWLYSGGTAGLWEPLRPVVLPLILGFFWFAGLDVIAFGHLIAIGFAAGCLLITFMIGRELFKNRAGLLSVVILAMAPIFFSLSTSLLTDIPSTFFSLLAVWFFIKKGHFFSGLSAGLAFLTRFPQGLVFFSIIILLIVDSVKSKKTGSLLKSIAGFCVVIPYFIFNQMMYGSALTPLPYAVEAVHGEYLWLYNLGPGFYLWSLPAQSLVLVFSLVGLYFYFKKGLYHNRNVNAVVLCLILLFGYFTLLAHKDVRFAIPFIPYLALLSAYGFVGIFEKAKMWWKFIAIIIICILLAPSAIQIGDYINKMRVERPNILTECQLGPGRILSSTPMIVKYYNNPISDYYSLQYALETYYKSKNASAYIIFTPDTFPCPDKACESNRNNLLETIKSENELLCEGRGAYNQTTYIFKT